jgi:hypothetical protein
MDRNRIRKEFVAALFGGMRLLWPVLSGLLLMIMALGLFIGWREGWTIEESIYFAFVSGLTIGYGDLAPKLLLTRALAVLIGFCGVLFTALVAAVAVKALPRAKEGP